MAKQQELDIMNPDVLEISDTPAMRGLHKATEPLAHLAQHPRLN